MNNERELVVQALGRPAFLGQLYDATTAKLINSSLFPDDAMKPEMIITTPVPKTDVQFKEVKSARDRAHLLNVSASVSVSILGGSVKVKGFGSYLEQSDISEDSTTIAGVVRARTVHKRLDISDMGLQASVGYTPAQLRSLSATHVVTAITYRGTLLGSLTESRSHNKANKTVQGKFSLSVLQKIAALGNVKGSAELTDAEKTAAENYSVETRLIADYVDHEGETPVKAETMIAAIEKGLPKFSSDPAKTDDHGVALDLILTPVGVFDQTSIELIFRELAEDDLNEISRFHDKLFLLVQRRNALLLELKAVPDESAAGYDRLFPSLFTSCTERTDAVEDLLTRSRGELGDFLKDYRSLAIASDAAPSFLAAATPKYNSELLQYEEDLKQWNSLRQLRTVATESNYPLRIADEIYGAMKPGPVVLVLIPPGASKVSLLNTYRRLDEDMRSWQKGIDDSLGSGQPSKLTTISFYTDTASDEDFLGLGGASDTLSWSLSTARSTSKAVHLRYGPPKRGANRFDWMAANQNLWGVTTNPQEGSKYIGEMKEDVPHGWGARFYVNGTSYHGNWCLGDRDGRGRIVRGPNTILDDNLYMDNKFFGQFWYTGDGVREVQSKISNNALLVEVTVHNNNQPQNQSTFCVPDMRKAPTAVAKMAKVFGWKDGERLRLTPYLEGYTLQQLNVDDFSIVINGSIIESRPSFPQLSVFDPWPDWEVYVGGKKSWLSSTAFEPWAVPFGTRGVMRHSKRPIKIRADRLQ